MSAAARARPALRPILLALAFAAAAAACSGDGATPPQPPSPPMPPIGADGAPPAAVAAFSYCPPGLLRGPREPAGYSGREIVAPNLEFPIAFDPNRHGVVLNSQLYHPGGSEYLARYGRQGSSRDPRNFAFPWYDTFCEQAGGRTRYRTLACPTGAGHQGVDIRPPTVLRGDASLQGEPDRWAAVALFDGTVKSATGAVVTLEAVGGGLTAIYRHLNPSSIAALEPGRRLRKGDFVGRVSNFDNRGVRRVTTPHLHLEIVSQIDGRTVHLPPYASILAAYRARIGLDAPRAEPGLLAVDRAAEQAACVRDY